MQARTLPIPTTLITGGAGFFGDILKRSLLDKGWRCVSIDLHKDEVTHDNLTSMHGDIRDRTLVDEVMARDHFDVVFHCAAVLAHDTKDKDFLWTSNVEGTRVIAEGAKKYGVPKIVHTSTNCLWGGPMGRPIREDDPPLPVEIYGKSKWEGEKILQHEAGGVEVVILRCPTIIDSGRLGLLAILFEFITEGRMVWVVGGGVNRYQFIYAQDLVDACFRSAFHSGSEVFNIGSDDVKTFQEVYQSIVSRAGTGSKVASLPRIVILPLMRLAHALGLSPLGPYRYKMIAEDFEFDTTKIKAQLGWRPSLTNEEMLFKSYQYFQDNLDQIRSRTDVSSHRKAANMGVIRVLKWVS